MEFWDGMSDDDYEREYNKLTEYEDKIITEMADEMINEGLRKIAEEERRRKQMVQAIILGGGNIGDVEKRLEQAERLIGERAGEVVAHSAWHTSKAWGFRSQNDFTNRAFVVNTALSAEQLLDVLQAIECELGRDREQEYREKLLSGEPYASRKIDLDILLYGEQMIATERLHIPHPRIMQREFALEPLCEVTGLTREQMRQKIEKIVKQ